jgi:hypothetical protein
MNRVIVFAGVVLILVLICLAYGYFLNFVDHYIPQDFWTRWGGDLRSKAETLQGISTPLIAVVALVFAIWRSYISWVQAVTSGEQIKFLRQKQEEDRDHAFGGRFQDACKLLGEEDVFLRFAGVDALVDIASASPSKYLEKSLQILCHFVRTESEADRGRQKIEEDRWEQLRAQWQIDFQAGDVNYPPQKALPIEIKDKAGRDWRYYKDLCAFKPLKSSSVLVHALESISKLQPSEPRNTANKIEISDLRLSCVTLRKLNYSNIALKGAVLIDCGFMWCSFENSELIISNAMGHVRLINCNLRMSRIFCTHGDLDIFGSYVPGAAIDVSEAAAVRGGGVWIWSDDAEVYKDKKRVELGTPADFRFHNTPQQINVLWSTGQKTPLPLGWTEAPDGVKRFSCELNQLRGGTDALQLNEELFK